MVKNTKSSSKKSSKPKVERQNSNTTLDTSLYFKIKVLGVTTKTPYNELIEEGMRMVLKKYNHILPIEYQDKNIHSLEEIASEKE